MFTDITKKIQKFIPKNSQWLANIYSPYSTCCFFQNENKLLHLPDIGYFLNKVAPYAKQFEVEDKNIKYLHSMIFLRNDVPADELTNGQSQIRSLFLNSSENIPIQKSKLLLGELKRIFFVELHPMRDRRLIITFVKG